MCYGRFLSTRIVMAKHTTIATIIPTIPGNKYMSAAEGAGLAVGAAVGWASMTVNAVVSDDGQ